MQARPRQAPRISPQTPEVTWPTATRPDTATGIAAPNAPTELAHGADGTRCPAMDRAATAFRTALCTAGLAHRDPVPEITGGAFWDQARQSIRPLSPDHEPPD